MEMLYFHNFREKRIKDAIELDNEWIILLNFICKIHIK